MQRRQGHQTTEMVSGPAIETEQAIACDRPNSAQALTFDKSPDVQSNHHDENNGVSTTITSHTEQTPSRHEEGLFDEPSYFNHEQNHELLRAILLRHYIDHLARWLDLCDPEKHFELVVPQRARTCPPLMSAILCASARHISQTNYQNVVRSMPQLRSFSEYNAVHYHNEAIQELIKLASTPEDVQSENLLAAAILLRWYEEIDAPLRVDDQDSELFLRVLKVFITKLPLLAPLQGTPALTVSNTNIPTWTRDDGNEQSSEPCNPSHLAIFLQDFHTTRPNSLWRASFWVAIRQEIYNCFLKQKWFAIPLSHCSGFRSFSPADDVVWANRLVVFCADCIEFCYGSDEIEEGHTSLPTLVSSPAAEVRTRWCYLKQLQENWEANLPEGFEPVYATMTEFSRHNLFPELWYLSDYHVTGLQHLEPAKILLTIYDPHRPKIGSGHFLVMKNLKAEVQAIVRKLCGMALGNRQTPPAIATACLGIAMCGDRFDDEREQEALLSILDIIQKQHGWPFGETANQLKRSWGWSA